VNITEFHKLRDKINNEEIPYFPNTIQGYCDEKEFFAVQRAKLNLMEEVLKIAGKWLDRELETAEKHSAGLLKLALHVKQD